MNDIEIIDLYWARNENAIAETDKKYGKYCYCIAQNILANEQDSEECVNDTYLRVWDTVPPKRPNKLKAFLAAIVRNLSLDLYRSRKREVQVISESEKVFSELAGVMPKQNLDAVADEIAFAEILNCFLASLSEESRKIFMRRYFYFDSVKKIALDFGISESKVKVTMFRVREELREFLEKEGVYI